MRKVTKILLSLLSAIILLLIILPVAATLALSVPSVQNVAIDKALSWAGEKLGTTVKVSRITLGMFNRITVQDFYVSDWDGDTLLYVKRADARIASFASLLNKNLVLDYGEVKGGKFVVRETERGTFAVKEITDQLVNRERKGQFRLDIGLLSASGVEFHLLRNAEKREGGGIDFADMQIFDAAANLYDFSVDCGAVDSKFKNLSFVERSGFELKEADGHFYVYGGKIKVDDAHLRTERSTINLDYCLLDGSDWLIYRDYINAVPMDCRVSNCVVASEDVGYFAPAMWRWRTVIRNATASMKGTVADFVGEVENVTLADGGTLKGSGRIKGLIDVERTKFDIKVNRVRATTVELASLVGRIANLSIGDGAQQYINRVKSIDASGRFCGTIRDFEADAKAVIGSGGTVGLECAMTNPVKGRKGLEVSVATQNLNLSTLLATSVLGNTTFSADFTAEIGDNTPIALRGKGNVSRLALKGYDYENLVLVADIEDNYIAGSLTADDKALKLDAQAVIDLVEKDKLQYDAVVELARADLHAMGINKRDSVSVLSCNVGLSASGKSFDGMNGVVRVADAKYKTVGAACDADLIELTLMSDEDARTVTLESDFADAVFESRTPYKNVIYYLRNLLMQYIPLLYDESARTNIHNEVAKIGNEIAILSVTTKDIDPLLSCITKGLEVAEGSKVEMLISPSDKSFVMHASSEYMMHSNYLATNLDLRAGNMGDSLAMSMVAKDLYAGAFHFSGVDVHGGAKDNNIRLDAIFADSLQGLQGEVSANAKLSRRNNRRNVLVTLNQSSFTNDNTSWQITTDGIEMDSSRVDIRRFAVRSASQELYVNGVASRSDQDSVYMNLRNFSLAPFTQITNRIGYVVDGRTNGYATVHSVLKDSRIEARIEMDSVSVSGISVPDLLLVSRWDFGRSRASLDITTRKDSTRVIQGYFAPSKMRYYARMQTEGVKMSLLDPMLPGIISGTEGVASVDVNISGEGRMAELKGEIEVDSLATTIDYTQCRYSAPKATVKVQNNRFMAEKVPMFDKYGHEGTLSLDVSLAHLSNIEYNIDVKANNMEVLNTTEQDNSMFYGKVFATGTGSVRGDKAGVKMDFVAHSDDNTKFFMPLTDNSEIATADFVTFAKEERDTTSFLARKKLIFENRQKQRSSSDGAMDITLSLDIRPNAEAQLVIDPTVGDIIKGTGEGQINMRINPQADIFEMYGDYTIQKGSYLFTLQSVINKWFDIEPGSTIQWTGDPLDAILNIDAVYKLKASLQPLLAGSLSSANRTTRAVPVECFIHLTDRLMQPTVTFDIVVPSADSEVQSLIASALATPESKSQQFLYLIVANSFISETTNAMTTSMGASATAATGFEMLSNQFSNWLSSDDYKIVLRYRPRTEQMSDEVDFGFSKGLVDNRLLIEVEGNYIVDKAQVVNANSNFTGEAYLTWLIDSAGTLRLKGFTHTIDRFDENQGLQETGIGIYFKEDFNNAKDLRMRLKSRFTRDKNKKKKNAKESEEKDKADKKDDKEKKSEQQTK